MARSRCLLHVDEVDEFIEWSKAKGHLIEPPNGDYEVFRFRRKIRNDVFGNVHPIYTRNATARGNTPVHLTVWGDVLREVNNFLMEREK